MEIYEAQNRIPNVPDSRNNSWVSENLWGHRIERQPCQLLLLEFLSMAEGMHRLERLLDPAHTPASVSYRPYLSTQLRNILFKNAMIGEILREYEDTDEAWNQWFDSMAGAIANDSSLTDFTYLKNRFGSFKTFASIVNLLSRISIPEIGAKQWNHMRIHPIGPAAYYDERNKDFKTTRVQFTRTGELAYLMLARSSVCKEENKKSFEGAFKLDAPKNRLLCSLMRDGKPDLSDSDKTGTYLPYKAHPSFDLLAEDIAALFKLRMPAPDTFRHLAPLLAFHVMLYQLRTSGMVLGFQGPPPIVCEILAPKSSQVRKASIESLINNESLALQALEQYCKTVESASPGIGRILKEDDPGESSTVESYREALSKALSINPNKVPTAGITIEEVRSRLFEAVQKDYRDSAGDGLRSMSDESGLRSRIKTRQHRYCPSDQFLRNMVYLNVTTPMKETAFLAILHRRYGIVIGAEEAGIPGVLSAALLQKSEFEKNSERLMSRLIAMGLARRMSDSFTYIINPISQQHAP
jgi:hypothetical protein